MLHFQFSLDFHLHGISSYIPSFSVCLCLCVSQSVCVSLYISSWWDLICSILCSIFIRLFVVLPSVRILHILWLQVICHIYLSISMSIYLCIYGFQTFFLKLWKYMHLYRYSKACFSDLFLHTVPLISCYINWIS